MTQTVVEPKTEQPEQGDEGNADELEPDGTEPGAPDAGDDGEGDGNGDGNGGEARAKVRCEAQTTVGGTLYQCALYENHDGDHSFTPLEDSEQPGTDQEKATAKALKQLENEALRHANRVKEIIGDDAEALVQCALCAPNLAGWRFDAAPTEDVVQAVRSVIGLPDVSNFAPSATERQCDDCRGLGKVRTGSAVSQYETAICDACKGKGWVQSRPRLNEPEVEPDAPAPTNGAAAFPNDGIERDMFGTPSTDPDYGKMPNMRQRPIDYWRTNQA